MQIVVVVLTFAAWMGATVLLTFPFALVYAFPLRLAAKWVAKDQSPYWHCFWTSYIYLLVQGFWGLVLVFAVVFEGSIMTGPILALMVIGHAFIQAYTISKRLRVTPLRAICVMLVQTALIIPVAVLVGVVYRFVRTMPIW